ncbi:sensor histidine kinase [Hathewaya massiliensis]|uniref:sensor histidine kinase n=1 Tax=Hathewaya massiliensis TaxID=1964382 RepID=UPI001159672B|nr:GHKL domain-containing protein [Hathewaya massiliensis]
MAYIIFTSLLSGLAVIFVLYNLNLVKLNYKDLIILGVLALPIIVLSIIVREALYIPLIFITYVSYLFIKNRRIVINIMSVAMTVILFLTIDMMCGYSFLNIFNISIKELFINKYLYVILNLTVFTLTFLISKIIGILIKKINISEYLEKVNTKLTMLVVTNIITAGIVMYVLAMINKYVNTSKVVVILNIFLFIIYFISTISISIFYGNYAKKDILHKHRQEEFNQLKEYTNNLEYMHNEMRKFKHDYINIISTINGYIDEKNINGLERYFNENIIPLSKNINNNNNKLGLLQHIKVTGLKGLLSSKIVQAQSNEIDIFIDIAEDITRMDMDIIDICRIIGILFDNAIEASINCSEPSIKFGIINRKNSVVMVIVNSCNMNTPPIYKMFEKGFSTKGENRGLGLSNVKEIVDKKYSNVSLNTSMENQFFKQELIVKFQDVLKESSVNYDNVSSYNYNA